MLTTNKEEVERKQKDNKKWKESKKNIKSHYFKHPPPKP
jgi:hypothetical protein